MYQGSTALTRVFIFLFLTVSILAAVSGCSQRLSEEVVLRRIIERVAASASAKDIDGVFGYLSKDFTDNRDNDYKSLRAFVFYEFLKSKDINIVAQSVDVAVKDAQALVNMRLLLVGGEGAGGTSSLDVSLTFHKEDGRWMARSASWKEIGAL